MEPRETFRQRSELQLLDVREADEWQAGHVEGSVHIPMGELEARLSELEAGGRVVAICRSGSRSGQVTEWLRGQGWTVDNLDGGLQTWAGEGLPLVDGSGSPEQVA